MSKLTDHALCDIELTQDEVYKIRLSVAREFESLRLCREKSISLGLSHDVEDHLIPQYYRIMDKLDRSEKFWLDRGHFHLRFILDRGCADE